MMLVASVLLASAIIVLLLRFACRHGYWLPIGRGLWVRRWYAPVRKSDAVLLSIQENLRNVCMSSIDALLDYPIFKAKTADEMRSAVRNKVILEIFSERDKKTVACHVAFWTPLNVHIGLVLVDKVAQGRGLQQLTMLNILLLVLDWACFRFRMSDLGFSSSAFRIMSETVYQAYPNLFYRVNCQRWHLAVANLLLAHHREDMGISSKATFDPQQFVIHGSNAKEGGGAYPLVSHTLTRRSRFSLASSILEDLLGPEDEQLYVGEANFLVFLWRALPVLPRLLPAARWIAAFAICGLHNYVVANLSWYTSTILKLMSIKCTHYGRPVSAPALWVCNHYSYLDALVAHTVDPNMHIVAKADLATEMPPGFFARFMVRVFNRGGFLWYNRGNDATIRTRILDKLRAGRSVMIFSEGTSQRSGPPMAMRSGAVEIAQEAGVPLQVAALRYSLPIGLTREDSTMRNAKALFRIQNLNVGFMFGKVMDKPESMDLVRDEVTRLWEQLGDEMRPRVPAL